ncbi:RHS repeat-associated core domain-containing protein [Streptomyces sp. SID5998]|nr:RHS repeat-associated core domain-containing protein [Streptomyces sp. SID5998]
MAFGIGTSRWRRAVARRRGGRLLGQALALALIVPTGLAQVAQAAEPGGLGRPDVPGTRVGKVTEFHGPGAKAARQKVARDKEANAAQARRAGAERKASWPKPGQSTLTLARGRAAKADPAGVPITISPQPGETASTKPGSKRRTAAAAHPAAEGTARVAVLDQKAARAAGITGALFTAQADNAGTAKVSIDYSGFASAVGGGWSQRLQLVQLPACALTTPGQPQCRKQQPLISDNDTARHTVSATVNLAGGTSGAPAPTSRTASTAPSATVFALTAAAGSGQSVSGTGSYAATPLSPASSWQAGGSSGSFTWSYDFTLPPAAAGPVPPLSLSYDSGSIDGRTATTNNQGTSVGEGFTLTESYIERSYNSCDDDGHDDVYDQCWKYDNARLVLNGKSTRLIKDKTSGDWRLENDDASKVTRSTGADNGDKDGEYWTVTTSDGTKYVFGLDKLDGADTQRTNSTWTVPVFGDDAGEPGYTQGDTFADRAILQAWRWNLDYVEDTHGNAATYWYAKESNYYKKNKATKADTSYVRGGHLDRVEYGLRKGALFTDQADAKVTFGYAERCTASDCSSLTKDTADNWPDVPFDAICSQDDSDCNAAGPSFFTRKRVTSVDTFSYNATSKSYDPVDSWALDQQYLDGGDIGDSTDQVLTLKSLKRTAKAGDTSIGVDPISFTYQMRPNRVDATDDILPITRPRISTVTSETGAITTVTLSSPECRRSEVLTAPQDTNTRSCYPQYWHINGAEDASVDWFHKYRVLAVTLSDPAANNEAVEYAYDYSGAAWHYSDDPFTPKDERTWSDWRGYRQVTAWTGATSTTRSKTVSLYLQGMNGDKNKDATTKAVALTPLTTPDLGLASLTDSDQYAGQLREEVTYNGSTPITATANEPWSKETARQTPPDAGDLVAKYVRTGKSTTYTYLTVPKTWRARSVSTSYDDYGMPVSIGDSGDLAADGDETCTRTWYARNDATGLTGLTSRTRTVGRSCSTKDASLTLPADSAKPGDVLSDAATVFDTTGATTWSATQKPTKGDATWTGRATGYATTADTNGDRPPTGWQTVATTTYDTLGRPRDVTDNASHTTSTAYTPADAGPLTKTIVTDPAQYKSVNFIDPRRGLALRQYDINLNKTELNYDALGRLTDVWLPNRSRGSQAANTTFAYHMDSTKPSWVSTSTLKKDGVTYNTAYALYDALLRPLQTQSPTPQGGRLLTDTRYDTRGLAYQTYADIFDPTSNPTSTYYRAEYGGAPDQTETVFDGAGRPTSSTLYVFGVEKWTTNTTYTGDSTAITALEGGSAQRAITDVRGQTTETRAYAGVSPADSEFGTGPGASYTSTKFTYTLDGRQKSLTGPDQSKWTYDYDLFGRQSSTIDPDHGTTTTEYNSLDQVVKTTDSRGTSIITDYDSLGRVTGTWSGTKTDANQLTGYTYDTLLKGLPTKATRYVGGKAGAAYTKTVTAYDSLGRATTTQLELPDSDPIAKAAKLSALPFETTYNIDGTPKTTGEPALGGLPSEHVEYGYDTLGNLTDFGGSTGYLLGVSYSALGQPEQLTLGTGGTGNKSLFVTNTYETGTGRLKRSHVTDQTHPYMLQDLNYSYDKTGNVTAISDPTTLGSDSSAETQCFAYDGHQRMTEAWTPASQKCTETRSASSLSGPAPYWSSYTYNDAGQRLSETVHKSSGDTKTTYCYTKASQPHTLTGTTTKSDCTAPERSYAYDQAGNTTTRPGKTGAQDLKWSPEGQLSKLTEAGLATDYLYDADGSLLIRSTGNGERILYAGATELHLRADGTMWAQRYYSAGGITAAVRSNQTGTNKLTYLTGDHHGTSTLALTSDTAQSFTKRYTTPFGEDRGKPQYGPWPDDKGFLGATRDTTTGLTHIGAREYDPTIGQFLSVDPLLDAANPQTLNGYSYAANSPVTYSDPDGRSIFEGDNKGGVDSGGHGGVKTQKNRDNAPAEHANDAGTHRENPGNPGKGSGGTPTASDGQPMVGGVRILAKDELVAMGYAGGYPDSATYSEMLSKWATQKCSTLDSNTAQFCDTAARAGLLPGNENDPWGIKATYHCLTGRGDCGEAIVNDIITVATAAFGSAGKALAARGASTAVAAEAEESALSLLLKSACSFDPSTPVLLGDGKTKPIGAVKSGDKVATGDPETGKRRGSRTVTALLVHHDNDLVTLTVRDAEGRTSLVHTTSRHPFWDDTDHAWVAASNLIAGHSLRTATDGRAWVVAAEDEAGSADMYNLTVDDLHTYYVLAGKTPVLVHNSNCSPFTDGDIWDGSFDVGGQTVETMATVRVAGDTVHLDGLMVFPKGTQGLSRAPIGPDAIRQMKRSVAEQARSRGFSTVVLNYERHIPKPDGSIYKRPGSMTLDVAKILGE